ncbi:hypothetical protein OKW45_002692 [Paraburkholderia sp. WSM4175]
MQISPELRQAMAVSLEKEVMLLGMGSHIEPWDAKIHAAREQAARSQGMPEASLPQTGFHSALCTSRRFRYLHPSQRHHKYGRSRIR